MQFNIKIAQSTNGMACFYSWHQGIFVSPPPFYQQVTNSLPLFSIGCSALSVGKFSFFFFSFFHKTFWLSPEREIRVKSVKNLLPSQFYTEVFTMIYYHGFLQISETYGASMKGPSWINCHNLAKLNSQEPNVSKSWPTFNTKDILQTSREKKKIKVSKDMRLKKTNITISKVL